MILCSDSVLSHTVLCWVANKVLVLMIFCYSLDPIAGVSLHEEGYVSASPPCFAGVTVNSVVEYLHSFLILVLCDLGLCVRHGTCS